MLRVLLILIPLALAVYALVDCISTKDEDVRHLPKLVWILLIVLATIVGPLAWIFVGRERGGKGASSWGRGGGGGGWVAPDDNPEFLKSLGDEPRRAESGQDEEQDPDQPEQGKDDKDPLPEDREEDLRRRGEDGSGGPEDTPPSR
jgi:hypothetical protein